MRLNNNAPAINQPDIVTINPCCGFRLHIIVNIRVMYDKAARAKDIALSATILEDTLIVIPWRERKVE